MMRAEVDTYEKTEHLDLQTLYKIMNAASHHSDNPLHREELKNAIEKIKELKAHLKND
jgi:hypothetical protein